MISDEAVEAAAKAMSGNPEGWNRLPEKFRIVYRDAARPILEAAVPRIIRAAKADAWDEAYSTALCARWECDTPNPYRSQT